MKKTISGVLLALTAVFALVACGKKTTKAPTTGDGTKETTKKTTKEIKRKGQEKVISFYCWNDEFRSRLNDYSGLVEKVDGLQTILKDGNTIVWTQVPNKGSAYQDALDMGLDNGLVDMFVFEADYAAKYVNSGYVTDMATLGVESKMNNQYAYTKDFVKNAEGKIVASSWQGTPGIIVYNKAVAKKVWGDTVSYDDMNTKLSTNFAAFKTAAGEVAAKNAGVTDADKKLYTLIGPDCWYRTYGNNLNAKMFDGTKITIDKNLFQWAKDTKEFNTAGYIKGVSAGYALWGGDWGKEMGNDTTLCLFSCPWYTDFCLTGNRPMVDEDGNAIDRGGIDANDSNLAAVAGYQSWFWGGSWLTATKVSQQEASIKTSITDIITKMTTDTAVLTAVAKGTGDFTNDKPAMEALAESADGNSAYFGGQNVYKIYAASVLKADLSKSSNYDQQITENFQSKFAEYFRGTKTAKQAYDAFVTALEEATSIANIEIAAGVTVDTDITIA